MMSLTTYKEDEDRINMISKDIYLGYSTLRATSQVSVQKEEKYEKACLIISQLPVYHFGELKLVWLVVLTLNRFPKQCIKTPPETCRIVSERRRRHEMKEKMLPLR